MFDLYIMGVQYAERVPHSDLPKIPLFWAKHTQNPPGSRIQGSTISAIGIPGGLINAWLVGPIIVWISMLRRKIFSYFRSYSYVR